MRQPKLRLHKSGRWVVRLGGKDVYLGRDRAAAEVEYHRMLLEVARTGEVRPVVPKDELTICEVIEAYVQNRREYFAASPKSFNRGASAMRYLNLHFGHYKLNTFGMAELRRLREAMLEPTPAGRVFCRVEVNRLIREVTAFWKWAASYEMAPAEIYAKCRTLEPLRRGHTDAPEREPVGPVPLEVVEKTKAHLRPDYAAAVTLQLLTGARPGELFALSGSDIDRSGEVWLARLARHKTAHRGKTRTLYFGPQAQRILKPILLQCGTGKLFRGCANDYREYLYRAAAAAGVTRWAPNQLRHTAATELRKAYGVEVARAVLGHSHLNTTEIYAEVNQEMVEKIMRERG